MDCSRISSSCASYVSDEVSFFLLGYRILHWFSVRIWQKIREGNVCLRYGMFFWLLVRICQTFLSVGVGVDVGVALNRVLWKLSYSFYLLYLLFQESAEDGAHLLLCQVLPQVEGRVHAVEGDPQGVGGAVVQQPAYLGQVLALVGVHQVVGWSRGAECNPLSLHHRQHWEKLLRVVMGEGKMRSRGQRPPLTSSTSGS